MRSASRFVTAPSTASPASFALRNLVALDGFFDELARVGAAGRAHRAPLEAAEPANPLLRWGHGVYFGAVVPRIGGMISDAAAYRYLPKSVAYLPPAGEMLSSPSRARASPPSTGSCSREASPSGDRDGAPRPEWR